MHMITDLMEARAFAKNMAQSLADAAYWRDWYMLEITSDPPLDWIQQAKVSTLVRTKLPDGDGSVLWLDRCVVVVFQSAKSPDVAPIREAAEKALKGGVLTLNLFPVVEAAAKVKDSLGRLQGPDQTVRTEAPASYKFLKTLVPNIERLLSDWHHDKKLREGRGKPHIMIVDDDPMVLRLAQKALAGEYEVFTAENGAEAIAKHLQLMPDIIFLDIGLPDCDGLTLLNYMQQYDQDCRIVMFSADDFLKTRVRAYAGGAKGFLSKPFNLKAFRAQIGEWIAGKT